MGFFTRKSTSMNLDFDVFPEMWDKTTHANFLVNAFDSNIPMVVSKKHDRKYDGLSSGMLEFDHRNNQATKVLFSKKEHDTSIVALFYTAKHEAVHLDQSQYDGIPFSYLDFHPNSSYLSLRLHETEAYFIMVEAIIFDYLNDFIDTEQFDTLSSSGRLSVYLSEYINGFLDLKKSDSSFDKFKMYKKQLGDLQVLSPNNSGCKDQVTKARKNFLFYILDSEDSESWANQNLVAYHSNFGFHKKFIRNINFDLDADSVADFLHRNNCNFLDNFSEKEEGYFWDKFFQIKHPSNQKYMKLIKEKAKSFDLSS